MLEDVFSRAFTFVGSFFPSAGDISSCNTLRSVYLGVLCRLISVSFLIRTPGKETNIEPPLRLEKNGKINFSLWKQVNRPHLDPMTTHAKGAELFRFFPSIILALASHFLRVGRVKRRLGNGKSTGNGSKLFWNQDYDVASNLLVEIAINLIFFTPLYPTPASHQI